MICEQTLFKKMANLDIRDLKEAGSNLKANKRLLIFHRKECWVFINETQDYFEYLCEREGMFTE